jgi:hypothetical protein
MTRHAPTIGMLLAAIGLAACAVAPPARTGADHDVDPGARLPTTPADPNDVTGWESVIAQHGAALSREVGPPTRELPVARQRPPSPPPEAVRPDAVGGATAPRAYPPSPGAGPATAARSEARYRWWHQRKKAAEPPPLCVRVCRHVQAICYATRRVCQIADRLQDAAARAACSGARQRCEEARSLARRSCSTCGD